MSKSPYSRSAVPAPAGGDACSGVPDALSIQRGAVSALGARGRLRALVPAQGLDFASNDYLGLARSDALRAAAQAALARGVPVGAGASRLLRGNADEIALLEQEAAACFGHDAALYFATGHAANLALFSALPRQDDIVVHDALIHASARDGMRLGRAETAAFAHNDADAAAAVIADWRARGGGASGRGRAWIAVESLYSMDGDFAPLNALAALAEREDAWLIVDEAHATGVWPLRDGLGLASRLPLNRARLVVLHTCGKALGVAGGILTLDPVLRDLIVNRARPFIYSTAPSPLQAAVVRASLARIGSVEGRADRAALHARIDRASAAATRAGLDAPESQIVAVPVAGDHAAVALAATLQAQGFDVRAIRSPTVPKGAERLRVTITNGVAMADINALFDALSAAREHLRGEAQ